MLQAYESVLLSSSPLMARAMLAYSTRTPLKREIRQGFGADAAMSGWMFALVPVMVAMLTVSPDALPLIVVPVAATQIASSIARWRDLEANTDPLTRLPNRRGWLAAASAADRRSQTALLVVDLDGFKTVNDTHGHDTGDLLLQAAADRIGGPWQIGRLQLDVTGSVAVACGVDLLDELLRRADRQMYAHKAARRGLPAPRNGLAPTRGELSLPTSALHHREAGTYLRGT